MKDTSSQSGSAYAQIRAAILDGVFPMGSVLTENQLAEYVGASRTPVREAVHRLALEQVLLRDERGISVPDPGPEEIFEIYETRGILSVANARLAAERRTELDLSAMERHSADVSAAMDRSHEDRAAAHHQFCRASWRASHNRSLYEELERFGTTDAHFGGVSTLSLPGQWERLITYYRDYLDALVVRDADRAAQVADANTKAFRDARLQMWRERNRGS
ncbi:hypothetical protein GCM10022286_02590 [Gryllotalpicola daejeonensis]|uniref:HTH gntR-type domain-containing protein n=1 Tax=Gryllotalpicola daejeonensis TaxID=993087 RepID=A0ABP7ZDW2_9MICO